MSRLKVQTAGMLTQTFTFCLKYSLFIDC